MTEDGIERVQPPLVLALGCLLLFRLTSVPLRLLRTVLGAIRSSSFLPPRRRSPPRSVGASGQGAERLLFG